MAKERLTHTEVADGLWSMIPDHISRTALELYDVHVNDSQARLISEELMSLNLFWISLALHQFDRRDGAQVFAELRGYVSKAFKVAFGYETSDVERYFNEMEHRSAEYSLALSHKNNPVETFGDFAIHLLSREAIAAGDSEKAVKIALALVPFGDVVKAVQEIEIVERVSHV